ncbi:MAG: WD40/YVTN/BNR-like repeat-containing protein [Pyrinomonadaceae bacterium]
MLKSACLYLALLLSLWHNASAQWLPQASGTTVRLRGVSAVSATVAWASGDKGTFLRTTDGGRTWRAQTVPGAEELDFRDVDAFDADTAYLLAIGAGEKSRIYKTTDGGRSWALQFKNDRPAAFFDCMSFWDAQHGLAISDPVAERFLVIITADGGKSWQETPAQGLPPALAGEGAFAASGTCVATQGQARAWFATGGPIGARVFRSADRGRTWQVATTPLTSGQSAGIFSVTFWDALNGVAVGGDYAKEQEVGDNAAWSSDGGRTWQLVATNRPHGYRSAVALLSSARPPTLVAVGPTGADYSLNRGQSWRPIAAAGYHSVSFAQHGAVGWAVGEGGRVAKYVARPRINRRRR